MLSHGLEMSEIFPVENIQAFVDLPSLWDASLATKSLLLDSSIDRFKVVPSSGGQVMFPKMLLRAGCRFWYGSSIVLTAERVLLGEIANNRKSFLM